MFVSWKVQTLKAETKSQIKWTSAAAAWKIQTEWNLTETVNIAVMLLNWLLENDDSFIFNYLE